VDKTYSRDLATLHSEIFACVLCRNAGYFAESSPIVVSQPAAQPRVMLVGQAPASPLRSRGRPFSGQAGRTLFTWLARAGITENDFRERCYFTAITKCYPGPVRKAAGKGDRAPSAREQALCRPFLLRELALIQPALILTVGRLSMSYFLGSLAFTDAIGCSFERDGRCIVPLPHPSGVSRWTNASENQARLALAIEQVQLQWDRVTVDA
jgi:uracil-DNA glycosylase